MRNTRQRGRECKAGSRKGEWSDEKNRVEQMNRGRGRSIMSREGENEPLGVCCV